jgi:predicted PurR-regulated permease PerM
LAIAAAIAVIVYALVHLRVVVLPIIVALLASTLLLPLVRWLKERNVPDALAGAARMIAAALLVVAVATAVAPSVADQFDELRPQGRVEGVPGVLAAVDGTNGAIKQGGMAAQQADRAVATMLAEHGRDVPVPADPPSLNAS